jgi:hypothetical protein
MIEQALQMRQKQRCISENQLRFRPARGNYISAGASPWADMLMTRWAANAMPAGPNDQPSRFNSMTNRFFITNILELLAVTLSATSACNAGIPDGYGAADMIVQQWQITHQDSRLRATGTVSLTGRPGDRILLLKAPAVLTRFEGAGLRVTRSEIAGEGLCYVVHIPLPENAASPADAPGEPPAVTYKAQFEFQLEAIKPTEGLAVPTGMAAVQEIALSYDEAGWEVVGPTAMRVEQIEATGETTQAKVHGR